MITELVLNERLEGQFICSEPFNNKAIRSALHKMERKGTFAGGNPERQSENRRKYEPTENTNKKTKFQVLYNTMHWRREQL